jgi:hypothetical protein
MLIYIKDTQQCILFLQLILKLKIPHQKFAHYLLRFPELVDDRLILLVIKTLHMLSPETFYVDSLLLAKQIQRFDLNMIDFEMLQDIPELFAFLIIQANNVEQSQDLVSNLLIKISQNHGYIEKILKCKAWILWAKFFSLKPLKKFNQILPVFYLKFYFITSV